MATRTRPIKTGRGTNVTASAAPHQGLIERGRRAVPNRTPEDAEALAPPTIEPASSDSEDLTVKELSEELGVKSTLIIRKLVERGIFATINQVLDGKLADEIAGEFGGSRFASPSRNERYIGDVRWFAVTAPPIQTDLETQNRPDEVAMVRRAAEVLGINHLGRWLQSEIPSLGNQTPYALLGTSEGRGQVERLLLKIEHGVY